MDTWKAREDVSVRFEFSLSQNFCSTVLTIILDFVIESEMVLSGLEAFVHFDGFLVRGCGEI